MKEHKKIDELRWIRVFTPVHIPTYLVEQVRDRDYTVEDFLKYQETACIRMTNDGPGLNPLNHLYVLSNKDNLTKGFLWFTIDVLSKDICIQTFSMDKEYWGNGQAVEKLSEFIKVVLKKANLNKVYWVTNYPKHSERHGFRRSKSVLMEYTEEDHGKNINGGSDKGRRHQPSESTTKSISIWDTRESEPTGSESRSTSGTIIPELATTV